MSYVIFLIHKYTTFFSIIHYQRVKKSGSKKRCFSIYKKSKLPSQNDIYFNKIIHNFALSKNNNPRHIEIFEAALMFTGWSRNGAS